MVSSYTVFKKRENRQVRSNPLQKLLTQTTESKVFLHSWRSGYCYLNKGECKQVRSNPLQKLLTQTTESKVFLHSWRSGYCYLNKGECNLNQSKHDPFVERVAKDNS